MWWTTAERTCLCLKKHIGCCVRSLLTSLVYIFLTLLWLAVLAAAVLMFSVVGGVYLVHGAISNTTARLVASGKRVCSLIGLRAQPR